MISRVVGFCCLTCSAIFSLNGVAIGQDETGPRPDGEAIAAESWDQPREVEATSRVESGVAATYRTRYPMAYFSPTLKGHFLAQWMYVTDRGRRINFWGARIVRIEHDSPVRQLGLNPGDVITRLDGIPIWRDMFREAGKPWQIIEFENHFGRTEVRYILRGANRVRIGDMMLDGTVTDGFDDLEPVRP
jgi:hypothetical protein